MNDPSTSDEERQITRFFILREAISFFAPISEKILFGSFLEWLQKKLALSEEQCSQEAHATIFFLVCRGLLESNTYEPHSNHMIFSGDTRVWRSRLFADFINLE